MGTETKTKTTYRQPPQSRTGDPEVALRMSECSKTQSCVVPSSRTSQAPHNQRQSCSIVLNRRGGEWHDRSSRREENSSFTKRSAAMKPMTPDRWIESMDAELSEDATKFLPLPGGEGRGEGERKCKNSSLTPGSASACLGEGGSRRQLGPLLLMQKRMPSSRVVRNRIGLFLLVCGVWLIAAHAASAQTNFSIYSDQLDNSFQNWSWGTNNNFANPSPVHSGNNSISFSSATWDAISFWHPDFNPGVYSNLNFWANGGATGGQVLQVYVAV